MARNITVHRLPAAATGLSLAVVLTAMGVPGASFIHIGTTTLPEMLRNPALLPELLEVRPLLKDSGPEDTAWAERSLGHADEVRKPEHGARSPKAKLPASRDFR